MGRWSPSPCSPRSRGSGLQRAWREAGRPGVPRVCAPGADDVLVQAALTALALGPEAREALLQGVQVGHLGGDRAERAALTPSPRAPRPPTPHLLLVELRLPGLAELAHGSWEGGGSASELGPRQGRAAPSPPLPRPFPARCPSRLLKVPETGEQGTECAGKTPRGNSQAGGPRTLVGVTADRSPP